MLSASEGPCRDDSVNSAVSGANGGGAAPALGMVNHNIDFQYGDSTRGLTNLQHPQKKPPPCSWQNILTELCASGEPGPPGEPGTPGERICGFLGRRRVASVGALTSLTLLLAGVEAGVAVDELADGVEAAAAVAGVHHRVLEQGGGKQSENGGGGGGPS